MRISRFVIVAMLVGMGCNSANSNLEKARAAMDVKDYTKAKSLLNKVIDSEPGLLDAYLNRGDCNEKMNLVDSAIADYNTILTFDPKNTTALYYIAICKDNQKKFTEAIEFYNKALISKRIADPEDTTGNGQIFFEIDRNGVMAEKAKYDIAAKEIYYNRAIAYYEAKQIRKAYNDFQFCKSQSYMFAESTYMIGVCWLVTGKKDKACENFAVAAALGDTMAKSQMVISCH